MSVTEIAPRGGEFERTPPHDIDAEQCVLGGMLLSKDAISDVLEVIRPHDHYRPAHQIVHEVILDLYGRGEPADAVTVAAELTRRGEVGRVGGADYLHTLIASVPTAANAGYYARIVRERAILRRLVEVGTRIVQLGYSGDGEADDLVDQAQAEVYCGHRPAGQRGLPAAVGDHARRAGRDRGDRQPRRQDDRRAHRIRRPRRPHQRPASRPDDRHRRPAGPRQGAGAGHAAAHARRVDDDGRGPGR